MSQPHLFCFGLGFSAEVIAKRYLVNGWRVSGTVRETERKAALEDQGFEVHRFDRTQPLPPGTLADVTHVLISIPPDQHGDVVIDLHHDDLSGLDLAWIGYLSTTGVYGNHDGARVDEETLLRPTSPRSCRRAAAEKHWLSLKAHIFRLAGIYGPGRNALEDVRSGTARRILKPGQMFSRIHVDDIANVVQASMQSPNPGRVYNVCDDDPAPSSDVVAYACTLLQAPLPPEEPFDPAQLSPMAASFWADNKRVSNERMHQELVSHLRYPSYRDGLLSLLG